MKEKYVSFNKTTYLIEKLFDDNYKAIDYQAHLEIMLSEKANEINKNIFDIKLILFNLIDK